MKIIHINGTLYYQLIVFTDLTIKTKASKDSSNKFMQEFLFPPFSEIVNLLEIVNLQISLIYICLPLECLLFKYIRIKP
jgi:hypothetical protein